ncbi:MAG TPA: alpha/beta fold hydrolase [Polyangiales bacterium]
MKYPNDTDPQTRHLDAVVDGMRIHWVEMGDANASVPIVLLHGINDSHLSWRRIAPLLARHRRVIMPDLPGCGLSERPDASYTLAWHAAIITSWLRLLGIEQADVVGHSFGGGVAQMLLLEHPRRIRRLALVAPGGLGRDVDFWLRLATVPHVVERFGQPFMALGTRLALRRACALFSDDEIAQRCAMNALDGSARAFARTVSDVIDWRGQSRLFMQRAHEAGVLPPIAVYFGERDVLIPAAQGAAFAQSLVGVVFRQFAGCGHYLHHEQPDAFVSALCEFLDIAYAPAARLRAAPTPNTATPAPRLRQAWDAMFGAVVPDAPRAAA